MKNKRILKNLVGGLFVFALLHPVSVIVTDIGYSRNSARAIEYSFKASCTYHEIKSLKNEVLDSCVGQLFDSTQKPKEKLEILNEKAKEYEDYTELAKGYVQKGIEWRKARNVLAKPYPESLKNRIWPKNFKEILFNQLSYRYSE